MDYYQFAKEILEIRIMSSKLSYERHLSNLLKGETVVLMLLSDHEGIMYPKEISEKMSISTARTAVILGQLKKDGYIDRIADSHDNRQVKVLINEAGRKYLQDMKGKLIDYFADNLKKLDEQDVKDLIRIERKLFNEKITV